MIFSTYWNRIMEFVSMLARLKMMKMVMMV